MKTRTIAKIRVAIYRLQNRIDRAYGEMSKSMEGEGFIDAVKNYERVLLEGRFIASNIYKELKRKEGEK